MIGDLLLLPSVGYFGRGHQRVVEFSDCDPPPPVSSIVHNILAVFSSLTSVNVTR